MDSRREISVLRDLVQQARSDAQVQASTPQHRKWKARAQTILNRAIGRDSPIATEFREVNYSIGFYSGRPGEAEEDAAYFRAAVQIATSLIEAAVDELDFEISTDLGDSDFDAGLWNHIKHSVESQKWGHVASAAVIYAEDSMRRWSGDPTDKQGRRRTGKDLFIYALASDGPLALGTQENETDGWRNLGTGLVAAISNVDRHIIQDRDDARRYALGVVGLVSLLLTQIRHEHPDATA